MRPRPRTDIISIILLVMIWSIGFGLAILQQWRNTEHRAIQAETDKANAELSFLKAQINPHFLFNTLNNIYALAVANNENTAPSIMKLSQIMRYLTEKAVQDEVPLQEAVCCLTDYIDLHRLRFGPKVQIDYSVEGRLEGKYIVPLIFISFVENMFKYGISANEPAPLLIHLAADKERIRFHCRNRVIRQPKPGESTGIGIDNVRKRLEYAYPGRHSLQILQEDGAFTVMLEISY